MEHALAATAGELPQLINDCWNRIGVGGDGSCEQLQIHVHCRNCPVFSQAGQQLFNRTPPESFVQQSTEQLAQPPLIDDGDALPAIVFRVGEEWLALPAHMAIEITEATAIHRIPHRRERELMGLVNVRGELQLCISLHELLDIPVVRAAEGDDAEPGVYRLLVAERAAARWALCIDEIWGVQRVTARELTPAPATVARRQHALSRSLFAAEDGRRIGLLDEQKLFDTLQRRIG